MAIKKSIKISINSLGQVGYQFQINDVQVYIDPYLSNSVQENEADDLERLVPIKVMPERIVDADLVLISHKHRDHCDPETLVPLSQSSTAAKFIGPPSVIQVLHNIGINKSRILSVEEGIPYLNSVGGFVVHSVPAAHPSVTRDVNGHCECVGYVIQCDGKTIYHAGDTSVSEEVIESLKAFGEIDIAFIPVNERNFFRDRRGIIGNMSVREAFLFAIEINAKTVVPTHWDMFTANQVYREEIDIVYKNMDLPFELNFEPNYI